MFNTTISELIKNNKSIFEDINRSFDSHTDNADYTILDYNKILSDMCDYLEGYYKYKENGEEQYADKILSSTHKFYDVMFTDIKYRKPFRLSDMKSINEEFLVDTKKLQSLMDTDISGYEEDAMLRMADNQYKKLMKVYKDDAQIYLWLVSRNSKFTRNISADLYSAFENKDTPVIHKMKKND